MQSVTCARKSVCKAQGPALLAGRLIPYFVFVFHKVFHTTLPPKRNIRAVLSALAASVQLTIQPVGFAPASLAGRFDIESTL